ncbi:hypothetical protein EVAR_3412_1 [Eumeta japonica]|uniref:Uncharacterized protein n=1 Tax=Eumeta variegata TaxID=151549 RepID=A0A4C1SSD0_EUMVA|nr:hypothetical protein EVAR_3412_1 [Eumeta japonica]
MRSVLNNDKIRPVVVVPEHAHTNTKHTHEAQYVKSRGGVRRQGTRLLSQSTFIGASGDTRPVVRTPLPQHAVDASVTRRAPVACAAPLISVQKCSSSGGQTDSLSLLRPCNKSYSRLRPPREHRPARARPAPADAARASCAPDAAADRRVLPSSGFHLKVAGPARSGELIAGRRLWRYRDNSNRRAVRYGLGIRSDRGRLLNYVTSRAENGPPTTAGLLSTDLCLFKRD